MNSEATTQGATMQTTADTATATITTVYRAYDGQPFAERVTDDNGLIWERRLLINGPGRWYVIGSL